jgi:hypothetical protein
VDLLLVGHFHVVIYRSGGSLDESAAWSFRVVMTSLLGDVDLPLRSDAGSPNGGGDDAGCGSAMVLISSWSRVAGSRWLLPT